jgi:hypothetical protein
VINIFLPYVNEDAILAKDLPLREAPPTRNPSMASD